MYRLWVLWALCISCNQPLAQQVAESVPLPIQDAGVEADDDYDDEEDASVDVAEDASEDACLKKIGDRLAEQEKLIEEIEKNLDRKKRRRR